MTTAGANDPTLKTATATAPVATLESNMAVAMIGSTEDAVISQVGQVI